MQGKRELKTEKSAGKLWLIPACLVAALAGVYRASVSLLPQATPSRRTPSSADRTSAA